MSSIQSRVIEIVSSQLSLRPKDVQLKSRLVEDLGADSLDVVELVMEMEEEFETEIPDQEIEKFKTLQDVVDYISTHVS